MEVNLEEIWETGALFRSETRVCRFSRLSFKGGEHEFRGTVMSQNYARGLGYLIEIKFDASCRWSALKFRPKHFLNPMILLANRIFEATLGAPGRSSVPFELREPCAGPRLASPKQDSRQLAQCAW
jgi:hypothetical protein